MIECAAAGSAGLMSGLLEKMGHGGAARVRLYSGTRPASSAAPSTPLISLVLLAEPAGSVTAGGDLILAAGVQSVLLQGTAPTWARVSNGLEQHLFDCDARMAGDPDAGQEIVVDTATLYAGALLQITSGTFTALPPAP